MKTITEMLRGGRAVALLVALALLLAPAPDGAIGDEPFWETDVFASGADGYHTYRIPALAVAPDGTLLAFCEGRKTSREDLGDNDLLLKRSADGGRHWGDLQLVYEEGGDARVTIGNPTVVVDQETETIWLAMQRNGRDVLLAHSRDNGRTWSAPTDITPQVKKPEWGFYAVGPGVGIQLRHGPHRGRLMIPAYHRLTADKSGPSSAHLFFSDDHGRTWRLGGDVGLHTNECQVVETSDKAGPGLLLNMRNHWARSGGRPELAGARLVARSRDGGLTWTEPLRDAALVEPTCQASLVRYRWPETGRAGILLFANPAARSRSRMTVRQSRDEGRTWSEGKLVYAGSSAYCCLAPLPGGRIGLLYEREDYGRLRFASFTHDWLE